MSAMSNYSSPEPEGSVDNTPATASTTIKKENGGSQQAYYLGSSRAQVRDEQRVMGGGTKNRSTMSSDHGGDRDDESVSPSRSRSAYEGNGGTRHGSEESNAYSTRGGGGGKNTADGSTLRIIQHGMGTGRGGKGTPNITGGRGKNYTNAFAGSKIKHLKKPDGVPLWRKDIQFQFLHLIFNDDKRVFTNSYDSAKDRTFADVYVDAMARSSKTSKILRDKLLSEKKNALNMAMVCLLVNLGRMNTTLNFFPEMKAQLRTYHAIPSLQTYTDQNAYKQLQDAPRLKSILKGACEDRKEPVTIENLVATPVPRTNPINLIFLLSTYAPKVTETHFPPDIDFHDLVMRAQLSSQSRATAFLWLMWWYLESNFTAEDALRNPYGVGLVIKGADIPRGVPAFEHLTQEEADAENIDRQEEIEFGERMQLERKKYINANETVPGAPLTKKPKKGVDEAQPFDIPDSSRKGKKPRHSAVEQYYSDSDRTRSVSPDGKRRSMTNVTRINDLLNDTEPITPPVKVRGKPGPKPGGGEKSMPRIILKHKHMQIDPVTGNLTTRSILPSHPPPTAATERTPKPRSLTPYQAAVAVNRKERAEHIIDRKLKRLDRRNNRKRKREGVFSRTWKRIKDMEDPFANSDEEGGAGDDGVMSGIRFDVDGNLVLLDSIFKDSAIPGDAGADEGVRLNVIEANAQLNTTSHSERRRGGHKQLPLRAKYVNGTNFRGCAGLVPRDDEIDDFGEEAIGFAAAIRRTQRRLDRWEQMENMKASGVAVRSGGGTQESVNTTNGTRVAQVLEDCKQSLEKDLDNKEDQEMVEAGAEENDGDVDMSD